MACIPWQKVHPWLIEFITNSTMLDDSSFMPERPRIQEENLRHSGKAA
jgi:hypothetical protein